MSYLMIRDVHVTLALLSVGLFVLRAIASVLEANWLQHRWARVAPHLVDTLLLTMGVWMLSILRVWPHEMPWLMAKLSALVVYILLGTMAIKRGKTPASRAIYAVLALSVFGYMVAVAITRSVLPGL
ncbi:SirB2 family protein [Saccharospirillum impatiens]|uniref:SirB2 family protein n=1 Tax=Saccharospirillum impatiens TaxID=169438 RepID=UPI00041A8021|nr:SirB2 family protein [Saccharospirillum impatiens]